MTKPRKTPSYKRSPQPEMQIVYDLACEMSHSSGYFERDEYGNELGRDREILDALNWVRKSFGLKGNKET